MEESTPDGWWNWVTLMGITPDLLICGSNWELRKLNTRFRPFNIKVRDLCAWRSCTYPRDQIHQVQRIPLGKNLNCIIIAITYPAIEVQHIGLLFYIVSKANALNQTWCDDVYTLGFCHYLRILVSDYYEWFVKIGETWFSKDKIYSSSSMSPISSSRYSSSSSSRSSTSSPKSSSSRSSS